MKSRRLNFCVAMAVALHGGALAWVGLPSGRLAQMQTQAGGRAVQVRMLSVTPEAPKPQANVMAPVLSNESVASGLAETGKPDGDSAIDLDGYVPRRLLSVVPQPTAPVVLPFPAAFNDNARYTVVLNLYIEADGHVGRVEFEGVPLPEMLERAARVTFENARFTPGQVNGRIVKSLIKVEVDFDNLRRG